MRHPGLPFIISVLSLFPITLFGQDSTGLKPIVKQHTFGVVYDVAVFPESELKPAYLTSIEYTNRYKTPITVRVNVAQRFATTGMQLEADAYPAFNKKMYAYINAGIADDVLFPRYRGGASIFRSLPHAFEAEGGFRFLYFQDPVWVYTASLGKYYKNYLFNVSGFFTPSQGFLLQSYFFKTRYYFSEKSYMMLTFGTGISPDDRRNNNQLTSTKKLQSKRVDIGFRLFIKKRTAITFGSSLMKQQDVQKVRSYQINGTVGYFKDF